MEVVTLEHGRSSAIGSWHPTHRAMLALRTKLSVAYGEGFIGAVGIGIGGSVEEPQYAWRLRIPTGNFAALSFAGDLFIQPCLCAVVSANQFTRPPFWYVFFVLL